MILDGERVERALHLLDIPVEKIEDHGDYDEVYGHCPGHEARLGKKDHSASWSVNSETLLHNCFSCGYGGSLIGLIVERRGLVSKWGLPDYDAAKEWLRNTVGMDVSWVKGRMDALRESYVRAPEPVEMSEARLAVFDPPPPWALDARGLTADECAFYGIKWDTKRDTWITPIRWPETGRLMGWQEKGQVVRSFKNRPVSIKKSHAIFGWENFTGGSVLVVESPLDCPRARAVLSGILPVSTMGASVSEEQYRMLRQADMITWAFDNPFIDAAGRQASAKALATGIESFFFRYDRHGPKDIGDMSDGEIFHGVENARHCVWGKDAYLPV